MEEVKLSDVEDQLAQAAASEAAQRLELSSQVSDEFTGFVARVLPLVRHLAI